MSIRSGECQARDFLRYLFKVPEIQGLGVRARAPTNAGEPRGNRRAARSSTFNYRRCSQENITVGRYPFDWRIDCRCKDAAGWKEPLSL